MATLRTMLAAAESKATRLQQTVAEMRRNYEADINQLKSELRKMRNDRSVAIARASALEMSCSALEKELDELRGGGVK